jgi:hypothetical protein
MLVQTTNVLTVSYPIGEIKFTYYTTPIYHGSPTYHPGRSTNLDVACEDQANFRECPLDKNCAALKYSFLVAKKAFQAPIGGKISIVLFRE